MKTVVYRHGAWLLVFSALLLGCGGPVPDQDAGADFASALELYIGDVMEKFGIPGMTVAVTRGDDVVYTGAFGVRDLNTGEPMRPGDIFHMASVSKPFAATAVVQLVERGLIDLDVSPVTYLPYFRLDDERFEGITIRRMLNHTSGMPDVLDYEWDKPQYDEGAAERYVRSLSSEKMIAAPGERWRYSNIAFDTLGDVIAKVSGQSFEDYVTDHILDPLGMTESSFLIEEISDELRTSPHVWKLEPVVSEVYPYNRRHAPSSTLNSSVVEMTRWAIANLNRGVLDGNRILAEESYELLWTPSAEVGDGGQVGLSWFLGSHRGFETISHGGGDTGYRSYFVIVPEKDLGLIIAANYDLTPMGELYEGVLDIVLGHEPEMPKKWIALAYAEAYFSDGLAAAKARYRELESTAADDYTFDPEQLIYLAYLVMQNGQAEAALDALRFNTELFPDHLDTFDYLAEAYAEMGDTASAIETYKRLLEIDPANENASSMLSDLQTSQK